MDNAWWSLQQGNLRLKPILKITGISEDLLVVHYEEAPISEGLAIEAPYDDNLYVVIALVREDTYEPVGLRIEEHLTNWKEISDFRTLLDFAQGMIKAERKRLIEESDELKETKDE